MMLGGGVGLKRRRSRREWVVLSWRAGVAAWTLGVTCRLLWPFWQSTMFVGCWLHEQYWLLDWRCRWLKLTGACTQDDPLQC